MEVLNWHCRLKTWYSMLMLWSFDFFSSCHKFFKPALISLIINLKFRARQNNQPHFHILIRKKNRFVFVKIYFSKFHTNCDMYCLNVDCVAGFILEGVKQNYWKLCVSHVILMVSFVISSNGSDHLRSCEIETLFVQIF